MIDRTLALHEVGQQAELHHDFQLLELETKVSTCTTNRLGVTAQFILDPALSIGQRDLFEGIAGL